MVIGAHFRSVSVHDGLLLPHIGKAIEVKELEQLDVKA